MGMMYGGMDPFGYGMGLGGYGMGMGYGMGADMGYPALYGPGKLGYPGLPGGGQQSPVYEAKDGFDDQLMGRKKSDFGVFMTVAGITAVGLASIVAFRRTADRHFPRIVYPKAKPESSLQYSHNHHSGYHSSPQPYRPAPTCAESGWHTHPTDSYDDGAEVRMQDDRFDIARKTVDVERARVKKLELEAREKAQRHELPAETPTRPSEMPAVPGSQLAALNHPSALYNFVTTRNNKPNTHLESPALGELPAETTSKASEEQPPKGSKPPQFSYDPWILAGDHVKAEVERIQKLQTLAGGKPVTNADEWATLQKSTKTAELAGNLASSKHAEGLK